jgi:hypothetical protein
MAGRGIELTQGSNLKPNSAWWKGRACGKLVAERAGPSRVAAPGPRGHGRTRRDGLGTDEASHRNRWAALDARRLARGRARPGTEPRGGALALRGGGGRGPGPRGGVSRRPARARAGRSPHRRPLGPGRPHAHAGPRRGTRRREAAGDPDLPQRPARRGLGSDARDPHRVRRRVRPGRLRRRGEPPAPGRQHHRVHPVRAAPGRQVAGGPQGGFAVDPARHAPGEPEQRWARRQFLRGVLQQHRGHPRGSLRDRDRRQRRRHRSGRHGSRSPGRCGAHRGAGHLQRGQRRPDHRSLRSIGSPRSSPSAVSRIAAA